jgi:hypothetical protein
VNSAQSTDTNTSDFAGICARLVARW